MRKNRFEFNDRFRSIAREKREKDIDRGELLFRRKKNQRLDTVLYRPQREKVHFNYRFARRSAHSRTRMVAISA